MLFLKLLALCYTLDLSFALSSAISFVLIVILQILRVNLSANSEFAIFVDLLSMIIIFYN